MTLTPTDMLEIQTAIDEYERKFPRRPTPSAEVALAWRLGKREMARRAARAKAVEAGSQPKPDSEFAGQECNRAVWAWQQMRTQWDLWSTPGGEAAWLDGDMPLWAKKALQVGWWGMFAVVTACVFFFGAIVGGLK